MPVPYFFNVSYNADIEEKAAKGGESHTPPNGKTTVEYYGAANQPAEDYECGIWAPVIKKRVADGR